MEQQQPRGFRRFVQTPVGKGLLIAFAVLTVFATFVYVSTFLAIPVMLIVGLALPIYGGLKRPRYLAVSGLVVLLVVAPIATAVITQEIFEPVGTSTSSPSLPEGHGGAVLQNATVSPFSGTSSTNFTWTVTIFPQYLSPYNSSPLWISLYLSTCPGATGNNSPNCAAGYPFYNYTDVFTTNVTAETTVAFHETVGSNGIWSWQMGLAMRNLTTGNLTWIFLVGDPTYNGIEGPVVGSWGTIYGELIGTVYFDDLLFVGGPFYFILLIYMIFKNRERRRSDAGRRMPPPVPPTPSSAPPPAPSGSAPLPSASPAPPPISPVVAPAGGAPPPSADERSCPNCQAVVYANETTCWKCGAKLPGATA